MKQLESVEISEESKDEVLNEDQIDSLIENEDLIKTLLNSLTNYCKTTQSILHEVGENCDHKKHVFVGKFDHQTSIETHLELLTSLAAHSSYKISYNELSRIYEQLIDESLIEYDKEVVLIWIKKWYLKHKDWDKIFDVQNKKVKSMLNQRLNENV